MRTLALGVIAAGAGLAATLSLPSERPEPGLAYTAAGVAPAPPSAHSDITPEDLTAVVQRYCVVCHNDQLRTGNVSFQSIEILDNA